MFTQSHFSVFKNFSLASSLCVKKQHKRRKFIYCAQLSITHVTAAGFPSGYLGLLFSAMFHEDVTQERSPFPKILIDQIEATEKSLGGQPRYCSPSLAVLASVHCRTTQFSCTQILCPLLPGSTRTSAKQTFSAPKAEIWEKRKLLKFLSVHATNNYSSNVKILAKLHQLLNLQFP